MEIVRRNLTVGHVADPSHHLGGGDPQPPQISAHSHLGRADPRAEFRSGHFMRGEVGGKFHASRVTKMVPRRQARVTNFEAQLPVERLLPHDVPNRLKILRVERGLSQRQVADALGTSKQQYGRLENSGRRLADSWVKLLSAYFEVHPGELWEEMPMQPLTAHEAALLSAFRGMDDAARLTLKHVAEALASAKDEGPKDVEQP